MNKALIIFAREPVPGRVKTRLARDIGSEAAAELYCAMLQDLLECVGSLERIRPLIFWASDNDAIPAFPVPFPCEQFVQQGADLGERMKNAFEAAFRLGIDHCCCIGSDLPDLPAEYVRDAFHCLEQPQTGVVFGPAGDGGYYLVGMKRCHAGLFSGIAWSTSGVLESSLDRARELNLNAVLLPVWHDIDLLGDLQRLAAAPGRSAARTRSCFKRILPIPDQGGRP